jgi:hypothetical protein
MTATTISYAKGYLILKLRSPKMSHDGEVSVSNWHDISTDDDLYIICLINTEGPKGRRFFADKMTWKLLDKKVQKKVGGFWY